MTCKQINLSIPGNLKAKAQAYADTYGFKNIQELATEALREKVFSSEYDEDFTEEEVAKIEKLLKKSVEHGDVYSEKELMKILHS